MGWAKGQSGNPKGRPKGRHSMLALMKRDFKSAIVEVMEPGDMPTIYGRLLTLAKGYRDPEGRIVPPNLDAIKFLIEMVHGKAQGVIEVEQLHLARIVIECQDIPCTNPSDALSCIPVNIVSSPPLNGTKRHVAELEAENQSPEPPLL